MSDLVWLALGWIAYAVLHSLLAALAMKAWVTRCWLGLAPWYRFAYNGLATLLLLPLLWATYAIPGDWLWQWTGLGAWLANGLALAAMGGFVLASGTYDMDEFLGTRPLLERRTDAVEHDGLRISPLHRYVRHPWYALGLVLVWTRDMNAPYLVTAVAITLYFVIGAWLEERKLVAHFGAVYADYCARVPGLIPLPWKRLNAAEAQALLIGSVQGPGHG